MLFDINELSSFELLRQTNHTGNVKSYFNNAAIDSVLASHLVSLAKSYSQKSYKNQKI